MKRYKAYCFDLDGTVYRGNEGIETAVRFIHRLQEEGVEYYFITNNSSKTPTQLQSALAKINIEAPTSRIYSSAITTAKYISQHYKNAIVHVIGSDGLKEALVEENIALTDDLNADVVVMGIDQTVDYMKLAKATVAVQNGATLIGTNKDIKFPSEFGFLPGNGSFVELVANVGNTDPIYVGKPSPVMLEVIQEEYGYDKEDMVLIGDNYDTDILCGIQFGCDTIHVNTGVTSTEQVLKKEIQPTYCLEDLSEI
ncbi:HAD family hydrolase [Ureibacillus massiliensis 4400831 = CIP 108448 = CCUG 49529]|uniref:HAD family hydrolase n=1 Tax=Ureibacillus massiliensis 4400831 = CIP 108448 = CCUG 49529 TaxID=1211035 RepID=A0A0A3J3N1_9BACL|nr:TIGR01457 family HAD-type hydrolase [Ureibacillus massiliensis]KGR91659.1 HAD family hydrolase [Ureibacillus massiliensis 4400831 = CIP 108448 = CCUG 49529]